MLALIVLQVPLALFSTPAPPPCQLEVLPRIVLEERVLGDFEHRVNQYVRLQRRLARALPPTHLFGDSEDMSIAVDALHAAMVDARPLAQERGFFTPAVADVLAARLEQAISKLGLTPAEVLIAMNLGYPSETAELQVNGRFPAATRRRVWPELLAVLPTLPEELQYRFVGRDLVLIDVHADLVVDILRDALPGLTAWPESYSAAPRIIPPHQPQRDA